MAAVLKDHMPASPDNGVVEEKPRPHITQSVKEINFSPAPTKASLTLGSEKLIH